MKDLVKYTLDFFLTHSSHQYLSIDGITGRNTGVGQVFMIEWVAAFLLHHFLVAVFKSTITLWHNNKCFKDDTLHFQKYLSSKNL